MTTLATGPSSVANASSIAREHESLHARLFGSTRFPSLHGRVRYGASHGEGHLRLRVRNLRPLHGKLVTTFVDGRKLITRSVRRNGSLRFAVGGTSLVEYFRIQRGMKVVLRGPRGHIVAHGRLRGQGG